MTTLHGWKTGERGVMKSAWNFCQMSSSSSGLRNSDHSKVFPSSVNQIIWKFDQINKTEDFEINFLNFVQSKLLISISFTSSSKVLWFTQVHNPTLQPVFCHDSLMSILPGAQSRCIPGIPNNGASSMLACIYPRKRTCKSCLDWNYHTKSPRNGKDSEVNFVVQKVRFLSWNPRWEACMVSGVG